MTSLEFSTKLLIPAFGLLGLLLLQVKTENATCGGVLNGESGTFSSPNFPGNYNINQRCKWYITVPENYQVELRFKSFQIESCTNCDCDLVNIYDTNALLGKFCGDQMPPHTRSTRNGMLVVFYSNGHTVKSGFEAEFVTVPGPLVTTPVSVVTRSPREILRSEAELAKEKLFKWFMGLRKNGTHAKKWGHQLPRIAVALFLGDKDSLTSRGGTIDEINYELSIQLLSKVANRGSLKRRDLSLYIHALTIACVDPRNFNGLDLVSELRSAVESSNSTVNPFELLVLCNAGDTMSDKDVQMITTAFDSQHRPFWTDNQAMATLALSCVSGRGGGVSVDERTLVDMAQELKKRQFKNGTVDNLRTTALVVQALTATQSLERDFDLDAAIRVLLGAQKDDGSVGSLLDSYYVLPALSNASLVNITAAHCKRPDVDESEALDELQGSRGARVSVIYSMWIGTEVDLKRTWTLKVPANSSLYGILETVQKLDTRQQVKYNVIDGKPYVSSVMGIQDDIETGLYWFMYIRHQNSEDLKLVEESSVDVKIRANQELILWYKSEQWNKPSSSQE